MISVLISRIVILILGTLYPAYASYKAVRTKNVKEYVKWMMYWIVFALFTCAETVADIFVSWFPFYYEIKIIFVLWLLSPATRGSSILYRKFVHPLFVKREEEIDSFIAQASEQGYYAVISLGSKGLSYATNMVIQGQAKIAEQVKSYSTSDVSRGDKSGAADKVRGNVVKVWEEDIPDGAVAEMDNRKVTELYEMETAKDASGIVKRSASAAVSKNTDCEQFEGSASTKKAHKSESLCPDITRRDNSVTRRARRNIVTKSLHS